MLGPTFPRTGRAATAVDGRPATVRETANEAVSWMTTNGPMLAFDLLRRPGDAEAADTAADRN
jgi:hypothetical protein